MSNYFPCRLPSAISALHYKITNVYTYVSLGLAKGTFQLQN